MINKMKKLFVLMLVAAVVSFSLTGCKKEGGNPSDDHPTSEHPQ